MGQRAARGASEGFCVVQAVLEMRSWGRTGQAMSWGSESETCGEDEAGRGRKLWGINLEQRETPNEQQTNCCKRNNKLEVALMFVPRSKLNDLAES